MCRLLPWWQPLWAALETEPVFLVVVRDPGEVAMSLDRREGISPAKAHVFVVTAPARRRKDTRGQRRHFLGFERFMEDWASSLAPLERFLGGRWKDALAAGRQANEQFLDRRLLRASATGQRTIALPRWLEEASALFASACGGDGTILEQNASCFPGTRS